jgi:hypothetical protein
MLQIGLACFTHLPLVSFRSEFVSCFNQSYLIIGQVSASLFYKRIDFHLIHNTAIAKVTQIRVKLVRRVLTNVILRSPNKSGRRRISKILRFAQDDNGRLNSYNMVNYKIDKEDFFV